MLGAAAVLPSVVTLPSGAQTAAQSFTCLNRRPNDGAGVERFTTIQDEWLRKKVFTGKFARSDRPAYCTTWDQPNILAIAKPEMAANAQGYRVMGYSALNGTTWSDGQASMKVGAVCSDYMRQLYGDINNFCSGDSVDAINTSPDHYGLVYVDETGLSCSLEPGPGMVPVRETCWLSIMASRGTSLG